MRNLDILNEECTNNTISKMKIFTFKNRKLKFNPMQKIFS